MLAEEWRACLETGWEGGPSSPATTSRVCFAEPISEPGQLDAKKPSLPLLLGNGTKVHFFSAWLAETLKHAMESPLNESFFAHRSFSVPPFLLELSSVLLGCNRIAAALHVRVVLPLLR